MTPKEKAKELVDKFESYYFDEGIGGLTYDLEGTKEYAILCAETHIYSSEESPFVSMDAWYNNNEYWQQVKKEIEKL